MAIGRFGAAAPAWSLAAVAFLTTCAEVALLLASSAGLPLNAPDEAAWIDYPQRLLLPLVGVLIARARPANPVGWLLLGYGAGSGVVGMNAAYAELGITSIDPFPASGPRRGSRPGPGWCPCSACHSPSCTSPPAG